MTTLERAARALWIEQGYPAKAWGLNLKLDKSRRASCVRSARTVLQAIREPDEASVYDVCRTLKVVTTEDGARVTRYRQPADVASSFTTMIDAILSEGDGA